MSMLYIPKKSNVNALHTQCQCSTYPMSMFYIPKRSMSMLYIPNVNALIIPNVNALHTQKEQCPMLLHTQKSNVNALHTQCQCST